MDSRKEVLHETLIITIGQVICIAVMFAIFALLGYFDRTVVFGGILGGILAILNFLFMAISVCVASDRAVAQDVKGGKSLMTGSMVLRYVVIFIVWVAGAVSGLCNAIAMVLPIVFVRPTITVWEFFRKKETPAATAVAAEPADEISSEEESEEEGES
ncbi:MAG: ATP synthase subunit I [Oscillospiraceae bacterium]|nr:ATP synthase subunit I [Ruminococcus sp.]MCD8344752.1 ATP synthase subunit I [Oscillospiraceae bacterium]